MTTVVEIIQQELTQTEPVDVIMKLPSITIQIEQRKKLKSL